MFGIECGKSEVEFSVDYEARPSARTIENKMIRFTGMIVVEGKTSIGSVLEIESADACATRTLLVDRAELPVVVFQNEACAGPRSIEDQMVQFPAFVVVEGKALIGSVLEIESANAGATGALLVDRTELPVVIF